MKRRNRRITDNQKAIISVCTILAFLTGIIFINRNIAKEEQHITNMINNEILFLIDSTSISNEYFMMDVPEDFVSQVSYEAQVENGRFSVHFYTESFEDGEKGMLAGIRDVHIADYAEYELAINTDIEDVWNQYIEQASIGGEQFLVDMSEDKTYAFEYWYPTDVQWSTEHMEKEELYFSLREKLDTAITTFQATEYVKEQIAKAKKIVEQDKEQAAVNINKSDIRQEELTMDRVIDMFKEGKLGTADYFSFVNAEVASKEQAKEYGWLNYYVNFYLEYKGEVYRLGASHSVENDTLQDMYLTRESDMESRLIYSIDDRYTVLKDIEEYLNNKIELSDLLSIALPEGYTLGNYMANIGIDGGALIEPKAYEVKAEDGYGSGIPEWFYSGAISIIKYPQDWFIFEEERLVDKQMHYWNHTSEEKIEVLDGLAMPAILYRANHDLYTAAEMGALYEQGIELTEEETTSDYWYIYFASPESEIAYYLSLDAKQFSKEQAIEIAKSVRFSDESVRKEDNG